MTPKKAKAEPSAKAEKAPKPEKAAKLPSKNDLLVQWYTEHPESTRAEAAAFAGCTSSQVLWMFQKGRLPEGSGAARTGGKTKADLIVAYYAEHPGAKRAEVAAACGCTVQRVGEAVRAGLTNGAGVPAARKTKERIEKAAKPAKAAKAKKAAKDVAPAESGEDAPPPLKAGAAKKSAPPKPAPGKKTREQAIADVNARNTATAEAEERRREAAADAAGLDDTLGGED